jgi:hypothetical protein
MDVFNKILLTVHFIGLAMGFSASFGNMVMGAIIASAGPGEKAILGRFSPAISKLGRRGVEILWLTGVVLVFTKWHGFDMIPWQFHLKLTAAVLLTAGVIYMTRLERRAHDGDSEAAARMPAVGKVIFVLAVLTVAFAVWTFE